MFFTAAGSVFYIGGSRNYWRARPVGVGDFAAETWVKVDGISSLGRISGGWSADDITAPPSDLNMTVMETMAKSVRTAPAMQVVAGVIRDEVGQMAMLSAESSLDAFGFRIVLPDSAERKFVALVMAAEQAFDEANSVLSWVFSLRLQSDVLRT